MKPFAGDRFVLAEVARLCAVYKIQTIIETGTGTGATTEVLSFLAEHVMTIEIGRCDRQFHSGNVIVEEFSNSPDVLNLTLAGQLGPILFFLDAHECGVSTAIRGELEAIAKHNRFDSVIVIHDFKVPGRDDLGCDAYPGGCLDLIFISDQINHFLQRQYTMHFNDQAEGDRRGVLYLCPPI